ncbi:hypothetical protein ACFQX7_40585 [Luedemannella flava]
MAIVVLTIAIFVLAGLVLLLTLVAVLIRIVRHARNRRRERLARAPRRALLAFVAEGGQEGMEDLLAIPPAAWQAAEPTAVALLEKVRGEAHQALAEVFARRGVTTRALRQLGHFDAAHRARAAELLGNLRLTEAVAPLCRLLADGKPEVRLVAVRRSARSVTRRRPACCSMR